MYRENELWLRTVDRRTGMLLGRRCIARNHARVAYPVDEALIEVPPAPLSAAPAGGSLAGHGGLRPR